MAQSFRLQNKIKGWGALAGAGTTIFFVGTAHQDFEIRNVSFINFGSTNGSDLVMDWELLHPTEYGRDKILVQGLIEGMTIDKPVLFNKSSGTVGYQSPIYARMVERSSGVAATMVDLIITIEMEKVADQQGVDTGVTPVWQESDEQQSGEWSGAGSMDQKAKVSMIWQGAVTGVARPGQNIQNAERGKMTDKEVQR